MVKEPFLRFFVCGKNFYIEKFFGKKGDQEGGQQKWDKLLKNVAKLNQNVFQRPKISFFFVFFRKVTS
jgi:hypothetical protein